MKLVLIGARTDGLAHLVLDLIEAEGRHQVVAFVDETESLHGTKVHGVPVIGPPAMIGEAGAPGGFICIGDPAARDRLAALILRAGLELPCLAHPAAHVERSARLGAGVYVGATAAVLSGAEIGDLALVSAGALVSHHVKVGRAASLSPRCCLGGRSSVGDRAFVGLNATVLPDRRVGEGAFVGAGALVIRDVEPGVSVTGVPASPIGV